METSPDNINPKKQSIGWALKVVSLGAMLLATGINFLIGRGKTNSTSEWVGYTSAPIIMPFIVIGLLFLWKKMRTEKVVYLTILIASSIGIFGNLSNLKPNPDRACQQRVLQHVKRLQQAGLAGQLPPPLPNDLSVFGDYRSMVEHQQTCFVRLLNLGKEIGELTKDDNRLLAPSSLADPSVRGKAHERLGRIMVCLDNLTNELDRLAGPAADALYMSMPGNESFKRGILKGLSGHREETKFAMTTYSRKKDYYRRVDDIVTLADQGVVGIIPNGKLGFKSKEMAKDYNERISELLAFETAMNADLKKLQTQSQEMRKNL